MDLPEGGIMSDCTPRIWVGCLAAYNAGTLHGEWIDCTGQDADDLGEEVARILASSPIPHAEEFAIMDHENLGRCGEFTSLEEIARRADCVTSHDDVGLAYLMMCDELGVDPNPDSVEGAHRGVWGSWGEYCEDLAYGCYDLDELLDTDGPLGSLAAYVSFNAEAFARDHLADGFEDYVTLDSRTYVFEIGELL